MPPLISVIVPVYNVAAFLPACIDSLLSQTLKDFELILVDDGSTDESPGICDDYARRDDRVRVIHKENGGLSDARNAGLDEARGTYVTLVDSDDLLTTDALEYLVGLARPADADIAVCQALRIDEGGTVRGNYARGRCSDHLIEGNAACMTALFKDGHVGTMAWGKLYRRSLFDDVRYPKGKLHEDVYTTYKLIARAERMAVGGEAKYLYRIRSGSITQTTFSPRHLDAVAANLERYDFIRSHYPQLARYAEAMIVYAANQCLLRMIKSRTAPADALSYLQRQYRRHEGAFLRGRSGLPSKFFSLAAWVSVRGMVALGRCR